MTENAFLTGPVRQHLVDVFELVKEVVRLREGVSRPGLVLGLQELGGSWNGFIGAYYPITSNTIVINKSLLRCLSERNETLLEPYAFHVLLHEYLRSLGYFNEETTRRKTYEISRNLFGEKHVVTRLCLYSNQFSPSIVYPIYGWHPPKEISPIELIEWYTPKGINSSFT
ncbi:MAG TPA: hypothetical protein VMT57_10050 [Candidatus Thermoplasmatota archaeon]|nr:hypothetical protein [Candidatus Thermoplasmatota archaeon]